MIEFQKPEKRKSGWRSFFKRLQSQLLNLIEEAVGSIAAILLIATVDFVIKRALGVDAKFFGYIPVQWVFDSAHLAVVLRLVWRIVKRFNK